MSGDTEVSYSYNCSVKSRACLPWLMTVIWELIKKKKKKKPRFHPQHSGLCGLGWGQVSVLLKLIRASKSEAWTENQSSEEKLSFVESYGYIAVRGKGQDWR